MEETPKIASIQYVPELKFFLALTDGGKLFRAFDLQPVGTKWEEIELPDFSKKQKRISEKGLIQKHHERTGK